jgi:hypothetical protein
MRERPYLFDVGATALAHSNAPVSDAALRYVRQAIAGGIDALVPYASVVGAHSALTTYYGVSDDRASMLMQKFMDAKRIHWYSGMNEEVVREGFVQAGVRARNLNNRTLSRSHSVLSV